MLYKNIFNDKNSFFQGQTLPTDPSGKVVHQIVGKLFIINF